MLSQFSPYLASGLPGNHLLYVDKVSAVQAAAEWEEHSGEDGEGQQVLLTLRRGEGGGHSRISGQD
jgi:hypothetical protein